MELAEFAPGVKDDGANVHAGIGTGPTTEQERAMGLSKEFPSGSIEILVLTDEPRLRVNVVASAERKKFGPLSNVAVTDWLTFIVKPQPVADAIKNLREAASPYYMKGGGDPPEPVLDAVYIAHRLYPWETERPLGRRIIIAVLSDDAKPTTLGKIHAEVPPGIDAKGIDSIPAVDFAITEPRYHDLYDRTCDASDHGRV